MSEHQIGRGRLDLLLKAVLNLCALKREKAIAKALDDDVFPVGACQELLGTMASLALPIRVRSEYNPRDVYTLTFGDQVQDCAATTDFNIVGMRA
ncbi:MAG TPA: hypothetical protein VN517_03510 [Terriglobales bacterium]|nr:hypothetical protein [Terriglobales bacterium]